MITEQIITHFPTSKEHNETRSKLYRMGTYSPSTVEVLQVLHYPTSNRDERTIGTVL